MAEAGAGAAAAGLVMVMESTWQLIMFMSILHVNSSASPMAVLRLFACTYVHYTCITTHVESMGRGAARAQIKITIMIMIMIGWKERSPPPLQLKKGD